MRKVCKVLFMAADAGNAWAYGFLFRRKRERRKKTRTCRRLNGETCVALKKFYFLINSVQFFFIVGWTVLGYFGTAKRFQTKKLSGQFSNQKIFWFIIYKLDYWLLTVVNLLFVAHRCLGRSFILLEFLMGYYIVVQSQQFAGGSRWATWRFFLPYTCCGRW